MIFDEVSARCIRRWNITLMLLDVSKELWSWDYIPIESEDFSQINYKYELLYAE